MHHHGVCVCWWAGCVGCACTGRAVRGCVCVGVGVGEHACSCWVPLLNASLGACVVGADSFGATQTLAAGSGGITAADFDARAREFLLFFPKVCVFRLDARRRSVGSLHRRRS